MKWLFIKTGLLMAPCLVFLIELALIRRYVRPSRRVFGFLALFGLVGAGKFAGFRLFGGDDFNPELPVWLIVAWGWFESVLWVGLPIGLSTLLVAWAARPFRRYAFRTSLVLSLVFATYGMWEGVRVPGVVEREVFVEGLPSAFDGYRLVHLSDLHCSSVARRGKIAAIVGRTNGLHPDMVAITGDFVDGSPSDRAADLEPLRELRARDGVFGCTGNHEGFFAFAEWEGLYRQWGVTMLRNGWREIRRGDSALIVGGEDDGVFGRVASDVVFRAAPSDGCRILLRHRPVGCETAAALQDVRLQLSGHTHGGAMPLIAQFVSRENQGHVRGLYREGCLTLHVSPGTGQWAGFPLRFFNSPEITLLVLRPY